MNGRDDHAPRTDTTASPYFNGAKTWTSESTMRSATIEAAAEISASEVRGPLQTPMVAERTEADSHVVS